MWLQRIITFKVQLFIAKFMIRCSLQSTYQSRRSHSRETAQIVRLIRASLLRTRRWQICVRAVIVVTINERNDPTLRCTWDNKARPVSVVTSRDSEETMRKYRETQRVISSSEALENQADKFIRRSRRKARACLSALSHREMESTEERIGRARESRI